MFGHPEAVVAEPLGPLRPGHGGMQGVRRRLALAGVGSVQDGEGNRR